MLGKILIERFELLFGGRMKYSKITKAILLLCFFLTVSTVNAQPVITAIPKTPSEAYKKVTAEKKTEEARRMAQQFAEQFLNGDWKEDELLNLAKLFMAADSFPQAEKTLRIYLKNTAAANPVLARQLLSKTFIEEKKFDEAMSVALVLLEQSDYDETSLGSVQAVIDALAATDSAKAIILFEKTIPGVFRLAEGELKKNPQFGGTLAGMLLAESLDPAITFREAGNVEKSEELIAIFNARFNSSQFPANKESNRTINDTLQRIRIIRTDAPDFGTEAQYLGMPRETSASFRGKVIILDFMAHWCVPCIEAFPQMNVLQEKYKAEGLKIIGVTTFYGFVNKSESATVDQEVSALKKLRADYKLKFGFIISPQAEDAQYGLAAKLYTVRMLPTIAVIDRQGKVRYVGQEPRDLEKLIQSLLGESQKTSDSK